MESLINEKEHLPYHQSAPSHEKTKVKKPSFIVRSFRKNRTLGFLLLSLFSAAVSLAIAFILAQTLLLSDANYELTNENAQIKFSSNLIGIDSTLRTMTIDWYPSATDCDNSQDLAANIYFDQNLLDSSSPGMDAGSSQPSTPGNPSASTAPSNSVIFEFDSGQVCSASLEDSTSTFRTISKLADLASNKKGHSTLQAYPIDRYISQISFFALRNGTNETIPMEISLTWGTVVNFKASLDRNASQIYDEGIYLLFDISRSGAVKVFVYCVIIANWIVTAAFLWLTLACILWENEKVVSEMFVIPVTALFAFTTVRANMPGAPAGFGAYVDFVGILPNLVLITFSSAVLLLMVLGRRIHNEIKKVADKSKKDTSSLPTAVICCVVEAELEDLHIRKKETNDASESEEENESQHKPKYTVFIKKSKSFVDPELGSVKPRPHNERLTSYTSEASTSK